MEESTFLREWKSNVTKCGIVHKDCVASCVAIATPSNANNYDISTFLHTHGLLDQVLIDRMIKAWNIIVIAGPKVMQHSFKKHLTLDKAKISKRIPHFGIHHYNLCFQTKPLWWAYVRWAIQSEKLSAAFVTLLFAPEKQCSNSPTVRLSVISALANIETDTMLVEIVVQKHLNHDKKNVLIPTINI